MSLTDAQITGIKNENVRHAVSNGFCDQYCCKAWFSLQPGDPYKEVMMSLIANVSSVVFLLLALSFFLLT